MNTQFGFAVVLHTKQLWPATVKDGVTTLHDLSGFTGSCVFEGLTEFFPQESDSVVCGVALEKAKAFVLTLEEK